MYNQGERGIDRAERDEGSEERAKGSAEDFNNQASAQWPCARAERTAYAKREPFQARFGFGFGPRVIPSLQDRCGHALDTSRHGKAAELAKNIVPKHSYTARRQQRYT